MNKRVMSIILSFVVLLLQFIWLPQSVKASDKIINSWTDKEVIDLFKKHLQGCKTDAERAFGVVKAVDDWYFYSREKNLPGIPKKRQGVCGDYAALFYVLGEYAGLDTCIATGFAVDDVHAWNAVNIDGKTYCLDVTWIDDDIGDRRYLKYFLFGEEKLNIMYYRINRDTITVGKPVQDEYINYLLSEVIKNKSLRHYDILEKIYGRYVDSEDEVYNALMESLLTNKKVSIVVKRDLFNQVAPKFRFDVRDYYDLRRVDGYYNPYYIQLIVNYDGDDYYIMDLKIEGTKKADGNFSYKESNVRSKFINDYNKYVYKPSIKFKSWVSMHQDLVGEGSTLLVYNNVAYVEWFGVFKLNGLSICDLDIKIADQSIASFDNDRYIFNFYKRGVTDYVIYNKNTGEKLLSGTIKVLGTPEYIDYGYKNKKIQVKSISVTPLNISISKGKSAVIKASVNKNATNKAIKFISSNTKIVTVDNTGKVVGVRKGKATIKVYSVDNPKVYKIVTVTVK